jgi:2-(1,2-epoxy-1,2-dihydrophenyl)acetyl-CoA isomerase
LKYKSLKHYNMNSISYQVEDAVAIITLNRPDKFNAFNREMALSMQQSLDDAEKDENVRAVLITGSGKAFCAGQDLGEVTGENPMGFEVILLEHYNPIVIKMREMDKPVICAVNGVAAGAGANIALAGDIVVASESASFIQAFSKIGLIPDSGGTFMLPRLIGFQKASAIMMLGDKVDAKTAEQMGMIYKVMPAEGFLELAMELAGQVASMPTQALVLTKKALNQSLSNNLRDQLLYEDKLQQKASKSEDYQEGVNAFMEKRKPVFKGK